MLKTTGERLKDLRNGRNINIIAEATGISGATLSNYENDKNTDISSYNLKLLAKYYNVSVDYLLGLKEQKRIEDTPIENLHISDKMIELLKARKVDNLLLSEIVTHDNFLQFMYDVEAYVEGMTAPLIDDFNAGLELLRQAIYSKYNVENDAVLTALNLGKLEDGILIKPALHKDIDSILDDIREYFRNKENTFSADSSDALTLEEKKKITKEALAYPVGSDEQCAFVFCQTFKINQSKIKKDDFKTFGKVLKKSKILRTFVSQRGKTPYVKNTRKKGAKK